MNGSVVNEVDHVLLTRFNVPTPGYESLLRAKEGWLRRRMELFETYCLPTVRAQSNRDFSWIVYLDPLSPDWLKQRMIELNHDDLFETVFRESISRDQLLADLRNLSGATRAFLLTSNLDNDDALSVDFVERVQQAGRASEPTVIYMTSGLIRADHKLYRRSDPDNAFCSLLTPWALPETCWADWHNRLGLTRPVIRIAGQPAWLQVIHESNVSNRVHGTRTSPYKYAHEFPQVLSGVTTPNRGALLADRYVMSVARKGRYQVRLMFKYVAGRVFGREVLDRIKVAGNKLGKWMADLGNFGVARKRGTEHG